MRRTHVQTFSSFERKCHTHKNNCICLQAHWLLCTLKESPWVMIGGGVKHATSGGVQISARGFDTGLK